MLCVPFDMCSAPAEADRPVARQPRVLVFDSGLGGLTVLAEVRRELAGAKLVFAADDAVFPYGSLSETALVERVMAVMERLVPAHRPDVLVIACNTASTLVLPPLRARWPELAVVGTVPAIKPAVALSTSRLVSVLATPGTVARQYTQDLVTRFAGDCRVTLVGAARLAALAEAAMRGDNVADAAIREEIAAAFVQAPDGRRTDAVVLACTHYPLLREALERVAPWPVAWIDPAAAIARRVAQVAGEQLAGEQVDRSREVRGADSLARGGEAPATTSIGSPIPALFSSGRPPGTALDTFLAGRGVRAVDGAPF